MRTRSLIYAWICLTAAAISPCALAESAFDPPPLPADISGSPSADRGLYNSSQPAGSTTEAAGAEGAPAATFVAPSGGAAASGVVSTVPFTAPKQSASNTAKPIEGGEIVARVDDQVILASDVLWKANRFIAAKLGETGQQIPPEELAAVQRQVMKMMVTQVIDTKLLFADFRRNVPAENLPKIEESIAEPFENLEIPKLLEIFQVKDREALEQALIQNGTSLKDVQRQFTENTIAQEWLKQRLPRTKPVTHEEMLAFYHENLAKYEYPAQVRWEELVVRFDKVGGDRAAAWNALASMGNEVWSVVAANPEVRGPVFAEVAKAKSHGFTASAGGQHDWTTLGALKCEEINQALATLQVGQMSNGIESELGFHIVRVLERKEAGRVPFTEAQAKIRQTLEAQQKEALVLAELVKVRKSARVSTVFHGDLTREELTALLDGKQRR